jgi:hypothetical protein
MSVAYSDDGLSSAADCPCHAIYAGCAEFGEVRLQTSFNSAAAGLHASAHRSDVAAAFTRNCRRSDQYGLARAGEVRQMRVEAGPYVARARRHVSARRPDISGTHPYDCAIAYVVESNTMAPIAKIVFRIDCPPFILTNCVQ